MCEYTMPDDQGTKRLRGFTRNPVFLALNRRYAAAAETDEFVEGPVPERRGMILWSTQGHSPGAGGSPDLSMGRSEPVRAPGWRRKGRTGCVSLAWHWTIVSRSLY